MDLQLQNMHTETQHYVNLTNSGAVAYDQDPEGSKYYMGLNSNREPDQLYGNL